MYVKFRANKNYLENVNGVKNFEESNIDYDSERDNNKQIRADFNNNGKQYHIEDSLQKFMNNMQKRHRYKSIFDLIKYDLHKLKPDTTNLSYPSKIMNFKTRNQNETKKFNTGKPKVSRGITYKLFDFDKKELPNVPNYVPNYVSKHGKKHTRGKK